MVENEILQSIDEVNDMTLESMIDVCKALCSEYEKSAVILEEYDAAQEGYSLYQEGFSDEVKKMGEGQNAFVRILTLLPRIIIALFRTVKNKLSKKNKDSKPAMQEFSEVCSKMSTEDKRELFILSGKPSARVIRGILAVGAAAAGSLIGKKIGDVIAIKKYPSTSKVKSYKKISEDEARKFILSHIKDQAGIGDDAKNAKDISVTFQNSNVSVTYDDVIITSRGVAFKLNPNDIVIGYVKDKLYMLTLESSSGSNDTTNENNKPDTENKSESPSNDKVDKAVNAIEDLASFYGKYVSQGQMFKVPIECENDKVYVLEGVSSVVDDIIDAVGNLEKFMNGGSPKKFRTRYDHLDYKGTFKKATPEEAADKVETAYKKFLENEAGIINSLNKVRDQIGNVAAMDKNQEREFKKDDKKVLLAKIGNYIATSCDFFYKNLEIWNKTVGVIEHINACYDIKGAKDDSYKVDAGKKITNNTSLNDTDNRATDILTKKK